MDAATLSLGALLIAIVVSCTIRLHVGFLAIALAWVTGVYIAGMSPNEVMGGFPTRLFLTLAGVTLLFSQAQANGTLDLIAHKGVQLCRGNVGVMPMMFFLLSFSLASIGPGNIASTALMAPMGMAVAGQVGIPAFLMAIMIGNGANAGSLSPIAPTGVIVNGVMDDIGLGGLRDAHLPEQHDGPHGRRVRRLLPAWRVAPARPVSPRRAGGPRQHRRRRRRQRR